MAAPKSTKSEIEARVSKVIDLLCMGLSRSEIVQYSAKEWGIAPRQGDEYIAKATAELKKRAAFDRDEELAKARERLTWLYKKCISVQDFQRALAVQKELNALYGLYAPTKTDITSGGERVQAITTIEVVKDYGEEGKR